MVEIPVTSAPPGMEAVLQDAPEFYETPPDLAAFFGEDVSAEDRCLLPRGWSILGKVIAVKIDPRIHHLKGRIGDALLEIYPRCSSVLLDRGVDGPFREPSRELIAGCEKTETVHREDGVAFKLDPMKVMFSPGNMRERMRMGRLGGGEVVVDMFAGIGYFTLPIAVHSRPKKIFAIEINPVAYGYLLENVRLNGVDGIVLPLHGDCAALTPEGVADRAVMGYVGTTDRYLDAGIRALRQGGVLHYHQTVPERLYPGRLEDDLTEAASRAGRSAKIERAARVKKYSPGMLHAVIDARIE